MVYIERPGVQVVSQARWRGSGVCGTNEPWLKVWCRGHTPPFLFAHRYMHSIYTNRCYWSPKIGYRLFSNQLAEIPA